MPDREITSLEIAREVVAEKDARYEVLSVRFDSEVKRLKEKMHKICGKKVVESRDEYERQLFSIYRGRPPIGRRLERILDRLDGFDTCSAIAREVVAELKTELEVRSGAADAWKAAAERYQTAIAEKDAEIARLEARVKALAGSLGHMLVKLGVLRDDVPLTGPSLIVAAETWLKAAIAEPRKVSDAQREAVRKFFTDNGYPNAGVLTGCVCAIIESPTDAEAKT